MTKHSVTTPLHFALWEAGGEHDMEARIEYSFIPGDPGRLSGPPEDCYPPEPAEVDITSIQFRHSKTQPWFDCRWLEDMLETDEELYDYLVGVAHEDNERAREEAAEREEA